MTATIQVFTFKDGLLARLAHDLRLTLGRFAIRRDGAELQAEFWPASLAVDGVVLSGGRVDADALSASDRRKIAANIAQDVLELHRFPELRLVGRIAGTAVEAELTMHGQTHPLRAEVHSAAGRLRTELTLTPSRWGIAPYRALAGAIRLQDRVVVKVDLPADPDGAGPPPERCSWTRG